MTDLEQFRPLVESVARSVSRKFPPYVDSQDTEQALYLWLHEKRASVLRTVKDGPDDWQPKIASTLRKVAFDHCVQEKAAAEGYSVEDVYQYSLSKIKELLPDALNYEDWQSFGQHGDGQPTARGQVNETGDRLAMLADIRSAFETLNDDSKRVLLLTFAGGYTNQNLADYYGTTRQSAWKLVERSLRGIQKELGYKYQEGPERPSGRRAARSTAHSRAVVQSQWDG